MCIPHFSLCIEDIILWNKLFTEGQKVHDSNYVMYLKSSNSEKQSIELSFLGAGIKGWQATGINFQLCKMSKFLWSDRQHCAYT